MKNFRSSQPRGGILVFALMCSGVAVLGLTFWVTTIAGRGKYVDTLQDSAARRVARANGSALAARFMEMRVLPGGSGTAFGLGFGGGTTWDWDQWGGIQLDAGWDTAAGMTWLSGSNDWEGYTVASRTASFGTNRISMGDAGGFGLADASVDGFGNPTGKGYDLPLRVLDGYGYTNFRWQARSYPAPLSGDLLSVHRSSVVVSGNTRSVGISGVIQINGRAHFHFRASDSGLVSLGTDVSHISSGGAVSALQYSSNGVSFLNRPISNYPSVYSESWATGSAMAAADSGRLNVVWKDSGTGYFLKNKVLDGRTFPENYQVDGNVESTNANGYSSSGGTSKTVTIDLSQPTLDGVVVKNARTLIFTGQTTATKYDEVAGLGSALVVVDPASNPALTDVYFNNENNRRLVLAVRRNGTSTTAVTFRFPHASIVAGSAPRWRMVLVAERTPITFSPTGGTVDIIGGIITDDSLAGPPSPGRLKLLRDVNPMGLITKAPRRSWIEGFRRD